MQRFRYNFSNWKEEQDKNSHLEIICDVFVWLFLGFLHPNITALKYPVTLLDWWKDSSLNELFGTRNTSLMKDNHLSWYEERSHLLPLMTITMRHPRHDHKEAHFDLSGFSFRKNNWKYMWKEQLEITFHVMQLELQQIKKYENKGKGWLKTILYHHLLLPLRSSSRFFGTRRHT
jgi:hypothetical protein